MSLPKIAAGQPSPISLVSNAKKAALPEERGPKSGRFGSTPAAALTISAQAKALAIKTGHDPDGVQDGK